MGTPEAITSALDKGRPACCAAEIDGIVAEEARGG